MKMVAFVVSGEKSGSGPLPVVAEIGPVCKSWFLDCRAVKSFQGCRQSHGFGIVVERVAVASDGDRCYAEPSTGDFAVRVDFHDGGTLALESSEDDAMSPAFPWMELLALLLKWLSTRSSGRRALESSSDFPMTSFAIFA